MIKYSLPHAFQWASATAAISRPTRAHLYANTGEREHGGGRWCHIDGCKGTSTLTRPPPAAVADTGAADTASGAACGAAAQ